MQIYNSTMLLLTEIDRNFKIGQENEDCAEEMQNPKTRDLPVAEYFTKLQEEYICAELRSKIYSKLRDRQYWLKVMEGKKIKIEDISLRNCLQSIFTSTAIREKYRNRIINKIGAPNFVYKDEVQKEQLAPIDFLTYYSIGIGVRVGEDGEKIGKVKFADFDNQVVLVDIEGVSEKLTPKELTRIL